MAVPVMVVSFHRDGRIIRWRPRAVPLLKGKHRRHEEQDNHAKPQQKLHPIDTSYVHNVKDRSEPIRLSTIFYTPNSGLQFCTIDSETTSPSNGNATAHGSPPNGP